MLEKLREESDSLGIVQVPAERLWGAQTQRSLQYFNIGTGMGDTLRPICEEYSCCRLWVPQHR